MFADTEKFFFICYELNYLLIKIHIYNYVYPDKASWNKNIHSVFLILIHYLNQVTLLKYSASQLYAPLCGVILEPLLSFLQDSVKLTVLGELQGPKNITQLKNFFIAFATVVRLYYFFQLI